MPTVTVTIDTSASIDEGAAATLMDAMSKILAEGAGVPLDLVHINLRPRQFMTWSGKLGGKNGAPHTMQIRVVLGQNAGVRAKRDIIAGMSKLLAPFAPSAATQFLFEEVSIDNLAIDGILVADQSRRSSSELAVASMSTPASSKAANTPVASDSRQTPSSAATARAIRPMLQRSASKDGSPAARRAAAMRQLENFKASIVEEGITKAAEIERLSEKDGIDFFCTTLELPQGDLAHLELSMKAMNAHAGSDTEGRKDGGSGRIGKMIFSAGSDKLAMIAYVPDVEYNQSADRVDAADWMREVCDAVGGIVVKGMRRADSPNGGYIISAKVTADPEMGKSASKDRDIAMASAIHFLRARGACTV